MQLPLELLGYEPGFGAIEQDGFDVGVENFDFEIQADALGPPDVVQPREGSFGFVFLVIGFMKLLLRFEIFLKYYEIVNHCTICCGGPNSLTHTVTRGVSYSMRWTFI